MNHLAPRQSIQVALVQADKEREEALTQLQQLQEKLSANRDKIARLAAELQATQNEVEHYTKTIPQAERQKFRADQRLRQLKDHADRVSAELAAERLVQDYLEELQRDDEQAERRLKEYVSEVLTKDADGYIDTDSESEWSVLSNSTASLKRPKQPRSPKAAAPPKHRSPSPELRVVRAPISPPAVTPNSSPPSRNVVTEQLSQLAELVEQRDENIHGSVAGLGGAPDVDDTEEPSGEVVDDRSDAESDDHSEAIDPQAHEAEIPIMFSESPVHQASPTSHPAEGEVSAGSEGEGDEEDEAQSDAEPSAETEHEEESADEDEDHREDEKSPEGEAEDEEDSEEEESDEVKEATVTAQDVEQDIPEEPVESAHSQTQDVHTPPSTRSSSPQLPQQSILSAYSRPSPEPYQKPPASVNESQYSSVPPTPSVPSQAPYVGPLPSFSRPSPMSPPPNHVYPPSGNRSALVVAPTPVKPINITMAPSEVVSPTKKYTWAPVPPRDVQPLRYEDGIVPNLPTTRYGHVLSRSPGAYASSGSEEEAPRGLSIHAVMKPRPYVPPMAKDAQPPAPRRVAAPSSPQTQAPELRAPIARRGDDPTLYRSRYALQRPSATVVGPRPRDSSSTSGYDRSANRPSVPY